ncbi:MAG TPA: DUF58 domain-containing protein [Nocardioidaceae bacterium]|jgi:uncharacterized protein (DUF58 family)
MRSALSTLTTRGRAFFSAGVAASVCAIILGQRDLLRVGILLVMLPLVTSLLANRARYLLSCAREITPTRVQAGQTATVALHLQNPGRVPTGLMLLEDQVPYVLGSRPRFVLDQLRPRWQRSMVYTVRSEVRGRYTIGPLTVRLSDPFGFVELTRAFTARAALVVTPVVVELPPVQLSGDWSGTGDNRPRAFAAAGTEDVTVREYRMGDDLRRIHWRSTARADELMVRREEQPYQSRATILLDTRDIAHRGSGPASSFEYAVSACASIGAHLSGQGFTIRLFTDEARGGDVTWHDRGLSGPVELQLLLDSLAVIKTSARAHVADASAERNASGLVIAVLGAVTPTDVAALATLRAGSTRALAVLVDVGAWARPGRVGEPDIVPVEDQALLLRRNGWAVVVAGPGDRLPTVWKDLANTTELRRDFTAETRASEAGPAA